MNSRAVFVGIDLRHADHNVIRRNRIIGSDPQFDMRGDGLRVWYSNDNTIEANSISDHRDVLIEYSTRNVYRSAPSGSWFSWADGISDYFLPFFGNGTEATVCRMRPATL